MKLSKGKLGIALVVFCVAWAILFIYVISPLIAMLGGE